VAREAAALVLTDDAFSSIVGAVRAGRRIYDNLKKAMAYIIAVHVPIAGMSLLPVLVPRLFGLNMPLVLMPVHIAFLELIIDPTCSVVFEAEAEERDVMERAPRGAKEPMFSRRMLTVSLLQGLVSLAAVLAVYLWAVMTGHTETDIRALTFGTLVVANLGLMFVNRSWTVSAVRSLAERNAALWWVTGGTVTMLGLLLVVPQLRSLFRFSVMHPVDVAIMVGAGIASVVWFEIYKAVVCRRNARVA
jgi:Ca2+-transporting ATPase